jgi:NADP-dependent alcohol dehydrogenase
MGVRTCLRDYGIGADAIPALLAQLERHGLNKMGEHGDIDLAASRRILELSVAA